MTPDELRKRLRDSEDNFTERKPDGVNAAEIRRTLTAFANSVADVAHPAVLFIGVRDDGTIQGITGENSMQMTVRRICEMDCYPPVKVEMMVLPVEGKKVLAVVVPPSTDRPHFSGPAYVRVGSESVVASEEKFSELIASRNSKTYQILKWKGQTVTLDEPNEKQVAKLIAADLPLHVPDRLTTACEVLECNAHYVRLRCLDYGTYRSEPLERIEIAYDEQAYRPKLILTPLR